jgi:hypothetical protein
MSQEREARGMRDAETILGIIRDRGRRGLPWERVYRLMFNPNLYLTKRTQRSTATTVR